MTADQIAYKYGCFIQPGAFGRPVLVDDPKLTNESWLTRLNQRRRARVEMIAAGVLPYGLIGGEP